MRLDKSFMMGHDRYKNIKMEIKMKIIITVICIVFMCVEFVGGYFSGSIAIMSDAAHMLSDLAGFIISFFAVMIAETPDMQALEIVIGSFGKLK